MTYVRKNSGVCSASTEVTLDDNNKIVSVKVVGGCNGNLKGVSALLEGMDANEAIRRLEGLRCGNKQSSCPDQIAQTLKPGASPLRSESSAAFLAAGLLFCGALRLPVPVAGKA